MPYSVFLIQSNYHQTSSHLDQLQHIAYHSDKIILMGDAILWAHDQRLQFFEQIFVLESESLLLNTHSPQISIIDYNVLADLILNTTQCIRLH